MTAEEEVSTEEGRLLKPKPCIPKSGLVEEVAAGCSAGENIVSIAAVKDFIAEAKNCTDATATAPIGGGPSEEENAPQERMTRLPQEEIDWILAREFRAPSDFEALRCSNPDLTPPPDEEMDESTKLFYEAAKIFYDGQATFFEIQEEVRQQYEEKHYVEVDDDYLATRAYNRAMILETWQEVCGDRVYSDDECSYYSDTDDEGVVDDKPISAMEAWLLKA